MRYDEGLDNDEIASYESKHDITPNKVMKHYYTELHTEGFKEGDGFKGFDSACAHFNTDAKIGSIAFLMAQTDAVKLIGGQQVSHGWTGYTIGNTFMQTGWEPVSVMSPAYEYRTEASSNEAVYKEVISR